MQPPQDPDDLTQLLRRMQQGDAAARADIVERVYPQLRRIAARRLQAERADHTLQPTALVNEVFVRLVGGENVAWRDRVHFFALCASLMRNILVDAARKRTSLKRGGGAWVEALDELSASVVDRPDIIIDIDRLLTRLKGLDARQAQVVEMRYFSGLKEEEIADVLGVSSRTVKRDWTMARAWLRKELTSP